VYRSGQAQVCVGKSPSTADNRNQQAGLKVPDSFKPCVEFTAAVLPDFDHQMDGFVEVNSDAESDQDSNKTASWSCTAPDSDTSLLQPPVKSSANVTCQVVTPLRSVNSVAHGESDTTLFCNFRNM